MQKIVTLMDRAGVRRTILSARGRISPEQIVEIAARHPDRITPAVRSKGEIYRNDSPKYYKRLEKQLKMPAFGAMAELILWHAQKGAKAAKVVVPLNDRRVTVALAAALERKWPFVAHIEFHAAAGEAAAFMAKLETMLRAHRAHPFALIHMGQLDPDEALRLIEAHPNIHFLTSHSNPVVIASSNQPWTNLFRGKALSREWTQLFTAHPGRFVLAFDNVFAEQWGDYYLEQAALWRQALDGLPHDVAHAVAHKNAERLWRLPAVN